MSIRGHRYSPGRAATLLGVLWTALALLACLDRPIDLDRLLDLHAEARGGRQALESVASIRVELHLVEPDFEADLVYQAMRPGMARVDVTIDGQLVFTEAVDGSGAWQSSGPDQPPEKSSPEGTQTLRRGAIGNLYGLHELGGLGYHLTLLEPRVIEGIVYHQVEVTAPDGHVEYQYFDPDTHLVTLERDQHAVHPDIDPTKRRIEMRNSDFRAVNGVVRSFRSVNRDLDTGDLLQTDEITRVILNPALDASIFAMPEGPRPNAR